MSKQAPGPKELALRALRENKAMETRRDDRDRKLTARQAERQAAVIPATKPRKAKAGRKVAKRA